MNFIKIEYISPSREFHNEYKLPAQVGGFIFTKDDNWIAEVDEAGYRFCQQFKKDFRVVREPTEHEASKYEALEKRVKALELKIGKLMKHESKAQ